MTALILVENLWSKEDGVCRERQLVRYRMKEGHLLPKEVVLRAEQGFFGHFGGHRIVANRYFVSRFGAVIDLQTKKVLHDEILGELVAADAKRVLFRVDNVNRESGLFAFDMKTLEVSKPKDAGAWGLPGSVAPDRRRSAFADIHGDLWIQPLAGAKRRLARGFRARLSMFSSGGPPQAPVFWLDDGTILTQTGNGRLVTVDMTGRRTPIVDIEDVAEPISSPVLERDAAGRLIYRCEECYQVDVAKRTANKTPWKALGHGFDCEIRRHKEYGSIVREHGKEIGRWFCLPSMAASMPGQLAIPFAKPKNMGYPIGVRIWDAPRRQWQTIRVSVNAVVGWVTGS